MRSKSTKARLVLVPITAFVAFVLFVSSWLSAQAPPPDVIVINAKVITVDERFTIAQALAVRGDRIVAVGPTQEIAALAGPATRRIDARGRAVIPGLIDNHMHLLRYGTTFQHEVRWDGVESRRQALDLLRARAGAVPRGQWIYNLGGWAIEQFADDSRPFTAAELDTIAPEHPVLLQASYYEAFLNTRAMQVLGVTGKYPTGRVPEDDFRALVAKLPQMSPAEVEASTRAMHADLNRLGLTTFGSAGCEPDVLPIYRKWADAGTLSVRVFCITGQGAGNPQQAEQALPRIGQMRLFQGDTWIDHVTYGESVYGPLHDPMFLQRSAPTPEQLAVWKRLATEVAKAGMPLHVHANLTNTIDAFLDQVEAINREYPVRNLRWALAHANQLNASHLERMKKLGLYAAVHPWAVINGGINRRVFGDEALDMAALATIQQSGVTWGIGSDGSRANQIRPFTTLGWAVTGKMVGGTRVLRQPISREDALIAHTRKNAYFVFQEDNLGSLQRGKLADLLVLDRDYLTVPADQIKDIRPVLTMVGGRVVYEAGGRPPAADSGQ